MKLLKQIDEEFAPSKQATEKLTDVYFTGLVDDKFIIGRHGAYTLEEGTNVTVSYKSGKTTVSGDRTVTAFIYTVNQRFEPDFVGVVFAKSTTVDEVTTVTYEDVLFTDILTIVQKVVEQQISDPNDDGQPTG